MKNPLPVALLALVSVTFGLSSPVFAADAASGAAVFKANCQACHRGGKNTVNPQKTLRKEDLEKYNKYSAAAIIQQVNNGAGAMPRFGGRLSAKQIEDVAAYVLQQANSGW